MGFLFSDSYISLAPHRPALTALQVVDPDADARGYLGADFDLRKLPVTSALYQEPSNWRQVKGDPAIRGGLFQQTRAESPMDGNQVCRDAQDAKRDLQVTVSPSRVTTA